MPQHRASSDLGINTLYELYVAFSDQCNLTLDIFALSKPKMDHVSDEQCSLKKMWHITVVLVAKHHVYCRIVFPFLHCEKTPDIVFLFSGLE